MFARAVIRPVELDGRAMKMMKTAATRLEAAGTGVVPACSLLRSTSSFSKRNSTRETSIFDCAAPWMLRATGLIYRRKEFGRLDRR
jgi:hypothetical protein